MHSNTRAAAVSSSKKIAVTYGQFPPEAKEDEQDVLLDVEMVSNALSSLGYEPTIIPVGLNLAGMIERISELSPLLVFNMVEAIATHDDLQYLPQSVLETYGVPFTGVNARGNFCTTDKILAKEILRLADLPTPRWQRCDCLARNGITVPTPCIVKFISADASKGMDDTAVCGTPRELQKRVESIPSARRCQYFAEEYIDGREFAVSLLPFSDGVRVLPPAETVFEDYPADKYKIVDFKAKWLPESFEYIHTVRRFDFPSADEALLEQLRDLSLRCWELFRLCGYARVDYRIDLAGKPWILELNGNPCISPDAGFMAATSQIGLTYEQTIQTIVNDALRRAYPESPVEDVRIRRRVHRSAINRKR